MEKNLSSVYMGVLDGYLEEVQESVSKAIEAGLNANKILKEGLIPAMAEVGRLFEEGEFFVPEMLVSARAMKGGLEILKPLLVEAEVKPVGKVVIGTVKGDLHDIGKNLVAMMLEGAGFEIIDLGTDVPPDKFTEQARQKSPDIVAISALLTTTMANMIETINVITESGLREKVKIMVGGAPLTEEYARKIGADGYAQDASQAAKLALSFIK
jgi:5-methyltetrahydrofolate--homocysteine methyltransferase